MKLLLESINILTRLIRVCENTKYKNVAKLCVELKKEIELIIKNEYKTLKCEFDLSCFKPVTHIDKVGFIYCSQHSRLRQAYINCRKLKSPELDKLKEQKTIKY